MQAIRFYHAPFAVTLYCGTLLGASPELEPTKTDLELARSVIVSSKAQHVVDAIISSSMLLMDRKKGGCGKVFLI